ncbi:MAG: NFACT RNA binding domain-containing protein [Bacteroidia bacterium]|nr:NFACT RNA binding domain-containing protein [Bacteroidia bacterium]
MRSLHQHQSLFPLLAEELNQLLVDFILADAFRNYAQNELVLVFSKESEILSIQLNTSCKTGLFLFSEHPISRDTGVFPVFKDLLGVELKGVKAHENNRSFQMDFGSDQSLVFKLYGPLSNVIYYQGNECKQLFRSSIENDKFLALDSFHQELVQPEKTGFAGVYYVYEWAEPKPQCILSFEPLPYTLLLETESVFEALNEFSKRYLQSYVFEEAKHKLISQFKQKIRREQGNIKGAEHFLKSVTEAVPYDEIGHILMANLHAIAAKETSVKLFDFYRNTEIEIPLKKNLSAQDNAAYYYQKFKNRKNEIKIKEEQLEKAKLRLKEFEQQLESIEKAQFLKELRAWIKQEKQKDITPLKEKFKRFERDGFQIYVGKNARNNDELTLKFSHKDDLWLHAKGVSGSHVLIKHKFNEAFPMPVIMYAAALAAHYSSSAGAEWVPVMYTPKKYVRKPKGANPGQVSVERYESVLVQPQIN